MIYECDKYNKVLHPVLWPALAMRYQSQSSGGKLPQKQEVV